MILMIPSWNRRLPLMRFSLVYPEVGVATVSAGSRHVLVAMRDGTVWGWGCNEANQLGTSSHGTSCADPVQVPMPPWPSLSPMARPTME